MKICQLDCEATLRQRRPSRDADLTSVEFVFLGDEVGIASLELCLDLGEFGVGADTGEADVGAGGGRGAGGGWRGR